MHVPKPSESLENHWHFEILQRKGLAPRKQSLKKSRGGPRLLTVLHLCSSSFVMKPLVLLSALYMGNWKHRPKPPYRQAVKPVDLIFPRWTRTQSFCLSCNKRSINIPRSVEERHGFWSPFSLMLGAGGKLGRWDYSHCAHKASFTSGASQWWRPSEAHCQPRS